MNSPMLTGFALGLFIFSSGLNAGGTDELDELLGQLAGEYRTAISEGQSDEGIFIDRHARVDVPWLGEHVMYLQLNKGREEVLYRQRLLVFQMDDESGDIHQTIWSFKEPERFGDGFKHPDRFASLTEADLVPTIAPIEAKPMNCVQVWARYDGLWSGVIDADLCRIWSKRREVWLGMAAETYIRPDSLRVVERGVSEDGEYMWGTKPGEFEELMRVVE